MRRIDRSEGSAKIEENAAIISGEVMNFAAANLVEISGLCFSYPGRAVLKGINLAIPRGKVAAILGVSGCGKTTLLRLVAGQLRPSQGYVKVAGNVVHELNDTDLYRLRRKVGMMFQEGGLFTDMSVFDNIAFPMRELTDLPENTIRDLVLLKLQAVGLRGARNLMPGELSGGMARRVALARAIALDPMLAMYDEPFGGLDPISLNVIATLIRQLNTALGATSIVVTYDIWKSLEIADYACFIHDGVVVAEGDAKQMLNSMDPFVHQFVHALPDGPVAFQYPGVPIEEELGLSTVEAGSIVSAL
jgi:phospholipid/cholesterol/gamma-HCH transport system ATP-binding protein